MHTGSIKRLEWLLLLSDKVDFKQKVLPVIVHNDKRECSSGSHTIINTYVSNNVSSRCVTWKLTIKEK
jgi:hypothetical protein